MNGYACVVSYVCECTLLKGMTWVHDDGQLVNAQPQRVYIENGVETDLL